MRAKILAPAIMTAYVQQRYSVVRTLPALVASVVLIFAMAILGRWADHRVQEGALQRAASETVLDMDNYIKPLVQGLAQDPLLSPTAQAALSVVLGKKVLGRDVAAIKVWSPSGAILYSNRPELIGR